MVDTVGSLRGQHGLNRMRPMLPRFEVASSRPLEVKHSVSSTLHDVSAKKQADAAKQQGIMKEGRCFFLMERPLG